ncbi:MAG: hypothetical protein RR649_06170 [Carnobacterium sp.]
MNQKGAILPSVVIFVFLITTVMIGTTRIYKNQMQQMMMTENYYIIQTMLALSKAEVQRQLIESEDFKNAVFVFEDGKVEVTKETNDSYTFIGTTKNTILNPIKVNLSFSVKNESEKNKSSETVE